MKTHAQLKLEVPYILSTMGGILYYASLVVALGLILTRNIFLFPFYQNITNFSIGYILVISIGLILLHQHRGWLHIFLIAVLLVGANFAMEVFVTLLNTPDLTDAIFGTIGTVFGLIFLWIIYRYYTRPKILRK